MGVYACMCASEGFVMIELKMAALIQLKRAEGKPRIPIALQLNFDCLCVYMRVYACICLYILVYACICVEITSDSAGKQR